MDTNGISNSNNEHGAIAATVRPFRWSVKRELWENRSIVIAPAAVAGAFQFGYLVSTMMLRHRMRSVLALDPVKQHAAIIMPYHFAAGVVMMSAFFVAVFYCLDALYGERRDRSILFWKSLPVSDRTVVLAKACIPLVVLPLLLFPIIVMTRLVILISSTAALLGNAPAIAAVWANVRPLESDIALLYALVVASLWYAPIYGWLLMISCWTKRSPVLWALFPPLAVAGFEKMAFGTNVLFKVMGHRMTGWLTEGFDRGQHLPVNPLTAVTPGHFLATPGLWVGFAITALCLTVAVRLRHDREPI